MRLSVGSLVSRVRRLGRTLRAARGRLAGRVRPAGRKPLGGRRPSRGPVAGFVVVGGVALALWMSTGSPERGDGRAEPSGPTVATQVLSTPAALAAERPSGASAGSSRRSAYYERTALRRVPARAATGFRSLYREAERAFGVNWRLLAAVHRQETAFSTAPTTYHGLNDFGCCAGPMQFNVTNGPVSTWDLYRNAFREARRPKRYPHPTRAHPSIYDDFDAIMAAGSLLRDSGAGRLLDFGAWTAAYAYYGHDLYGVTYANQVLARAAGWERDGFCPDCALDEGIVAEFEGAYGASARRALLDDEGRRERRVRDGKRRKQLAREREQDRRRRDGRRRDGRRRADERAGRRQAPLKRLSRPPAAGKRRPQTPAPRRRRPAERQPPPPAQPAPPTTAPPPVECPLIRRLLGCRPSASPGVAAPRDRRQ